MGQDLFLKKKIGIFAKNTMAKIEERWRDVVGYEGLYKVSNLDRVKSVERQVKKWDGNRTVPERILKSAKDKDGYQRVGLHREGKTKHVHVHRLVGQAFLTNPENLPQVNHKDEDKTNNNLSNIEFCDAKYNVNYGTRTERVVEKRSKPVIQLTLEGELIREWKSTNECGKNGYSQGHISACCIGERKSHKGYLWRFKE